MSSLLSLDFQTVNADAYKELLRIEKARRNVDMSPEYEGKAAVEKKKALLHATSLFALAKSLLHLLLHPFHLLGPLLAQPLFVVSDDGGVAHEGDEPDAEQVGEACTESLHGAAVTLRVLQVDFQDGSAEELRFPVHAIEKRVQVLVAQVVGVTLFKVISFALAVLRPCLHHLHELSKLVLQVLLHTAVLAVQRFLLDLHQRVAILLRDLVQRPVDGTKLTLQGADVLVVNVVQHHTDQGSSHAENGVNHGCCRGDGGHTLQHFDQALLQFGPVLNDVLFHHGFQVVQMSSRCEDQYGRIKCLLLELTQEPSPVLLK